MSNQSEFEPELQLVEETKELTAHQKMMKVYEKLNHKLDIIIEKRRIRKEKLQEIRNQFDEIMEKVKIG